MKIIVKFQNGFPKNLKDKDDPEDEDFYAFFFNPIPRLDISNTPLNSFKIIFCFLFWGVTITFFKNRGVKK